MRRKRIDGYALVSQKHGGIVHLRRDQYASIRKAWLEAVPFVDCVGLYGEAATLKLADVDGVFDMAPENVMGYVEDARADAADDTLTTS